MFDTHLDREHTEGWVNVHSLGASGDGASFDLTAAFNRAKELGLPIIVPDGTYRMKDGLLLDGGVRFRGAGGRSSAVLTGRAPTLLYEGSGDAVTMTGWGNVFTGFRVVGDQAGSLVKLYDALGNTVDDIEFSSANAAGKGIWLYSDTGCYWNQVKNFDGTAGTPLALQNALNTVNFNRFSHGNIRTNVANNGLVIWVNGGGANLFEDIDPSYYGIGAGSVVVSVQEGVIAGGGQGNRFHHLYIDVNAAAGVTGYFLGANTRATRVQGGYCGVAVPLVDSSGAPDNQFDALTGVGASLAGPFRASGGIQIGTPSNGFQPGSLYQGSGVPNNANGNNGDFYFRVDTPGVANQRVYNRQAGAWVGIL